MLKLNYIDMVLYFQHLVGIGSMQGNYISGLSDVVVIQMEYTNLKW